MVVWIIKVQLNPFHTHIVHCVRQLTSARLEGFLQSRADWAAPVQQPVGGEDGQVRRTKHRLWGGAVGRQGLPGLLTLHLGERRSCVWGALSLSTAAPGFNEEDPLPAKAATHSCSFWNTSFHAHFCIISLSASVALECWLIIFLKYLWKI